MDGMSTRMYLWKEENNENVIATHTPLTWEISFLSTAKEERVAEGQEKKEGATKWSQGTSNRICSLPEWKAGTYAGPLPWLTFPGDHQEARSRVDTISPEWQTGSASSVNTC